MLSCAGRSSVRIARAGSEGINVAVGEVPEDDTDARLHARCTIICDRQLDFIPHPKAPLARSSLVTRDL